MVGISNNFIKMYFFIIIVYCYIVVNTAMTTLGTWHLGDDIYSDSESHGDIAYIKLVTKIRHRRDLSKNDYHILDISVPSQNKNFSIHLTKETAFVSPDLSTIIHSEDGKRKTVRVGTDASHDCLYTGVVSGSVEGTAHLSSCDKSTPGFSGIIEMDQKHFLIQPASGKSIAGNASPLMHHPEIAHVIKEAKDVTNNNGTKVTDAIKVPENLVEEAAALMLKERGKSKKDDSGSSNEIENNFQGNLMDIVGNKNDNTVASQMTPLAAKAKSKKSIMDLAIFTDASLYRYFQKMSPSDASGKMKAYVLTIVNGMNLLYQDKSMGVAIQFRLAHLEIMKSDPSEIKADLHDSKFMAKFCAYSGSKNKKGELWDHSLLLTANDLNFDGQPSVAGVAYLGMMCIKPHSCSVAEAWSLGSIYTISHELLHSFGVEHDGEAHAASCSSSKYIMSPTTGGGKVTWSSCSSKKMKSLLESEITDKLAKYGISNCLDAASKSKSISYSSKKLPGEKYPIKEQCIMDQGKSAVPYTTGSPFSDICNMLYCGQSGSSSVIGAHAALEGSSCGSKKKCKRGECK